ncbi:unnamed protein product [Pocillopora meandrina]|uniref:Cysteine protease n=1 Tax=Pocillopora meandrina TaxID=46732 RepID=A0AAU9WY37_9CNID|nr:unnamed protein product [Pocillopora meandrina]
MAGSAGSLRSGLLNIQSASRQKSREMKDSSDSDDDELFDGEKLKTKLMSMWNNMRHGFVVPFKAHFNEDSPIWLLGRCYHARNHEFSGVHSTEKCKVLSMDEFQRDFHSLIWLTYRREIPQLGDSTLTTDCGWGCMLRSGQMMIATGLVYHFLKREFRTTGRCISREQEHFYKTILRFFGDLEDEERCPFSLHRLVSIGAHTGKQAGDWYGPASVAHILRLAMAGGTHPLLHNINVYVAQDCTVYTDEVEKLCTSCRTHTWNCSGGKWQSVIILVPVRLGGEALNPIYIPCVKSLFTLDHCIGIIGGRPKHSLYFVGFQDDKMVCLDPHYCQAAVDMSKDDFPTQSFHSVQPRTMSFKKMDPSCTIGFYCDTKADFERFRQQTTEVLRPPMQRGDYPMFIFASHRKPMASEDLVRSADLSESLMESDRPERSNNSVPSPSTLSSSPPTEEYVVL